MQYVSVDVCVFVISCPPAQTSAGAERRLCCKLCCIENAHSLHVLYFMFYYFQL